ncbi:MAG: helix-turn-helix transcriptional regulator [Firmicutes bacterium]|nr:helix-turn-helix transcriptional regulator [Bacillota bacterium]
MIGARLRALRRLCGVSQKSLAEAVRVSPSAIGMYEQDRREPSLDRLVALARRFGVSTDYLLTGEIRTPRDELAAEHFAALSRAAAAKR